MMVKCLVWRKLYLLHSAYWSVVRMGGVLVELGVVALVFIAFFDYTTGGCLHRQQHFQFEVSVS